MCRALRARPTDRHCALGGRTATLTYASGWATQGVVTAGSCRGTKRIGIRQMNRTREAGSVPLTRRARPALRRPSHRNSRPREHGLRSWERWRPDITLLRAVPSRTPSRERLARQAGPSPRTATVRPAPRHLLSEQRPSELLD